MKKVILIPDSFKGTLSSGQICRIMEKKVKEYFPECKTVKVPVADGGEGSVDCFLAAMGGEKKQVMVKGPYMEDMESFYGILPDGTAVIEIAACAGLPLVEGRQNPEETTTYGAGQLMLDAAASGCKKIVVGLGGSCTNDGGAGAAAAAGVRFYDAAGVSFVPTGGTLKKVVRISLDGMDERLKKIPVVTMCDIDNPMYGKSGAAYIFAPQKGADEDMIRNLDDNLKKFAEVIEKETGKDVSWIPGGGAAGAMGAGMVAFFGSQLQMGIETVLDTVNFDEMIKDADMIFTGEGKMDTQSLRGKVVIGVGKRAKEQKIPVTVVTGGAGPDIEDAYDMGIAAIFTINRMPEDFSVSRYKSEENMELTMDNIMRFIKAVTH
ncbi:MAG: glycerate kinase [Blautia sp.]